MNDLIKPALYESFHRILARSPCQRGLPAPPDDFEAAIAGTEPWDVVGPVCESGDFLAKDRSLPRLDRGALLAVFSAGAYGMVMASNYNTRPRAAEILVEGDRARLVRRRETYDDLVLQERLDGWPREGACNGRSNATREVWCVARTLRNGGAGRTRTIIPTRPPARSPRIPILLTPIRSGPEPMRRLLPRRDRPCLAAAPFALLGVPGDGAGDRPRLVRPGARPRDLR